MSYKDFINKELVLFSNMDNERSIPSLVDGLKPGSRKVGIEITLDDRNLKRWNNNTTGPQVESFFHSLCPQNRFIMNEPFVAAYFKNGS